jgi:ubiquinone biosynthesis UbiH/UbiF/VisC/COQ6 family hydroxylase
MGSIRYHHGMSVQTQNSPKLVNPRKAQNGADFCVVGGGIVGKASALGLAQLGYSVIQIAPDLDKNLTSPMKNFGQRIYAIAPSTKRLLTELNIWHALDHDRIQAVRDMRIFGDRGQPKDQLHFSAFEVGRPELAWIIEADLIEATLDQAICFHKQIININASVTDIRLEKDKNPILVLNQGEEIVSQLILAADGARSPLRSAIGINALEDDYQQMAVVANFSCSQPHLETAYQWFLPEGNVLALLPLPSQQVSMVWSCSPEYASHLLRLTPEAWLTLLQEQSAGAIEKALGTLQLQSTPASFPLKRLKSQGLIGPQYDPKVILLGDAAHVMHPLAGQGLNLGLRDVADMLEVFKNKEGFRVLADRVLLRRYERQREGDTSSLLWLTDRLKKLFSANNPLEKQIRNWGLGLVNRSHLTKRKLIERALGE